MCLVDIYIFLLAGLVDSYPDYITSPGGCTLCVSRCIVSLSAVRTRRGVTLDWGFQGECASSLKCGEYLVILVGDETTEDCNHRVSCYVLYIFFSLGSQVSLVSTDQVGDFCVVTLSSLSFARSPVFCSIFLPLLRKILSLSLSFYPFFWHFLYVNFSISMSKDWFLNVSPPISWLPTLSRCWNSRFIQAERYQKLLFNVANTYEPLLFAMPIIPAAC